MKFATTAALMAVASANVKKDQLALRDEMKSLLTLVKTVEGQNDEKVYDVISTRKEDLKALMHAHPERAGAISQEFKNLLAVVQRVEKNDFDGAMAELAVRKEELMGIHHHLLQMTDDKKTEETTVPEGSVKEWTIVVGKGDNAKTLYCEKEPKKSTDEKTVTYTERGEGKTE